MICDVCEGSEMRICGICIAKLKGGAASTAVQEWARKEKLYGNLTPAEYALFEKCADDLR